jgi:uncharacterized membrane protein YbhN (UPF0104 family)
VVAEDATTLLEPRRMARRLAGLLAVVIVGAVLIATLPGLGTLRSSFAGANPALIVAALLLELASVASFVPAFRGAFARRIPWRPCISMAMTVQGANVLLPAGGTGGLAVSGVILTRAGLPASWVASRTVALFLVTSLVSFLAIIVAGVGVASGVLAGNVGFEASALPALGAAVIVAAVAYFPGRVHLGTQPADGRATRGAGRALAYLDDGVRWSADLLRSRDPLLIFGSLGYLAFDVAAMAAAFRAFGTGGLPLGTLVLAYTLGQAGAIIPIPGSSEAGLIGVFVLYGAPLALATSAVLLYRVFQAGIPVIVGLIGMADVRHLLHEAPPPEEVARRFEIGQESSQPETPPGARQRDPHP